MSSYGSLTENMEDVCCSFTSLVIGDSCVHNRKDRKDTCIVPLLSCNKDIAAHKLFTSSDPENEVEFILCRAGIFSNPANIDTWSICPHHPSKLELGWTRGSKYKMQGSLDLADG